jgi:hypothetical protein
MQGRDNMIKFLTASIAATTLLGGAPYILGTDPEVLASTPNTAAKGDRLDARPACNEQNWPYYNHSCLRDLRNSDGRGREVRIVFADRLSSTKPVTHFSK